VWEHLYIAYIAYNPFVAFIYFKTNQFLVQTIKSVMEKLNQSEARDIYSNRQLVSAIRQISNGPEENVANETAVR
jgi:hypothetical protein